MHQGLLRQELLALSVCHASPAGRMMVVLRCASVVHAQGAECTKACFGKAFGYALCHASHAGRIIVIMDCASALHAQGAVRTKAYFGKPFDTLSVPCQPGWLHDCHHVLRICVMCVGCCMHQGLLRQGLLTLSVGHASPAGRMIVIMRCASVVYAQGAECTEACFGKTFLTLSVVCLVSMSQCVCKTFSLVRMRVRHELCSQCFALGVVTHCTTFDAPLQIALGISCIVASMCCSLRHFCSWF
jgi:hypothetical protein